MIVDSSALIAIVAVEPDHEVYRRVLLDSPETMKLAAPTLVEACLVADKRDLGRTLDAVLRGADLEIVPFDVEMALLARDAHRDFGRGSGHPAKLNLGDCFSYALATITGEPLLYKGDGFGHTDVRSVLA